jgi:DNA-binding NarL/FixJ family response regulator
MSSTVVPDPGKHSEGDARRILLVDDHPLIREGLAEALGREADLVVCGEAADRQEALDMIPRAKPDLAIVDLALRNSSGLELIKDLHVRFPRVRVLVVSMYDEELHAERALRAGASGYLTKEEATSRVVQAVRKVLEGGIYLSEAAAARLAARVAGRSRQSSGESVDLLCDRELEVFGLIGQGLTTRQIAQQIHLAVPTVETYRARIKEKLKLKDAAELLQRAIRWNVSRRF